MVPDGPVSAGRGGPLVPRAPGIPTALGDGVSSRAPSRQVATTPSDRAALAHLLRAPMCDPCSRPVDGSYLTDEASEAQTRRRTRSWQSRDLERRFPSSGAPVPVSQAFSCPPTPLRAATRGSSNCGGPAEPAVMPAQDPHIPPPGARLQRAGRWGRPQNVPEGGSGSVGALPPTSCLASAAPLPDGSQLCIIYIYILLYHIIYIIYMCIYISISLGGFVAVVVVFGFF